MPFSVPKTPHRLYAPSPDVPGEQLAEAIPPQPHGFVTYVDATLEQQVFHVP